MPSPFPGMDPYLEGYLWPDFRHRLATEISRQLTPRLRPRYVARLDIYLVEDPTPELEIGILYPDVEVVTTRRPGERDAMPEPPGAGAGEAIAITPAPIAVPVIRPVKVRLVTVEVRDVAHNELVTSIEILSPVNKREPGLSAYRKKAERLQRAGVHILEIDLIRRGQRPFPHPRIPDTAYRITLIRAGAGTMEVWPISLRDPLPVLPVPLRSPDPDVPLELGQALDAVYDEAAYELSIDYTQPPPPPPMSEEELRWLKAHQSAE